MFIYKDYIFAIFFHTRLIVIGSTLFACSSDNATDPTGPQLSFLSLFPDHRVLLVDDGFYFTVTAQDTSGKNIPDFVLEYTSSDPSIVRIEGDSRIQAVDEGTVTVTARAGGQTVEVIIYVGAKTYDLAKLGPPRVLDTNYIDLSKIEQISRFRSTVGHSYVDGSGETCRSIKHYFQPYYPDVDWTTVDIYAPASGTILTITPDGAYGYKVLLRPRVPAAMHVEIFHVNLEELFRMAG